ncbi:MAG: sensor histidine kinase [Catenulispora sp.]|nr:sensor histidine kinase [Catenulispora sp.]
MTGQALPAAGTGSGSGPDRGSGRGEVWRARALVAGRAAVRGLVIAPVSIVAGIPLVVLTVLAVSLLPLGVGAALLRPAVGMTRALTGWQRRLAREWSGVEIPEPYLPRAGRGRLPWLLGDPATWRDLLWLLVNVPVGAALGLLPVTLIGWAVLGVLSVPGLALTGDPFWPFALGFGVPALALAPFAGPALLRAQALVARSLLAPSDASERISALTETREAATDDAEAELRRIERDLHDGAQARLAAVGLSLGMAEDLVREHPEQAIALLAEARQHSGAALAELRSLVRGIHPPVLAERGLEDALRALAYASPLPVEVRYEMAERLPAPRETALYFAVAEALANVLKHSQADHARILVLGPEGRPGRFGRVSAEVWDDGVGGADADSGGGLGGMRRRLAAFDGTVTVDSPVGGPTTVTMEVPCA